MTSGHMLQQLDSEISRIAAHLQTCERELGRLAADRSEQQS